MIISIIIPIYNVERYIKQCLSSLFIKDIYFQYYNIEIIIVNDGTADKSMEIVEQFANLYRNIIIIEQTNQGLSVARNIGLEHATGDYIWFIDSDDWLTDDAISIVMKAISENPEIEVFATILNMYYEESGKTSIEYKPNPNVRTGCDYMFRNHDANCGACQRYIF